MAKNLSINLKCMVMGFEEKTAVNEQTKSLVTTVKVKLHDKSSKNDIDAKFVGTLKELEALKVEEYEIYDCSLEMKLYKQGFNQCVSFIVTEFKEF